MNDPTPAKIPCPDCNRDALCKTCSGTGLIYQCAVCASLEARLAEANAALQCERDARTDHDMTIYGEGGIKDRLAEALKWREAVTDAAVISWTLSPENENDPRRAVADLLAMQSAQALDPAVSREAAEWRDKLAEARRERAQLEVVRCREIVEIRAERDEAVEWIGVVRTALIDAGGKSGDRAVALENLRRVIAERDEALAKVAAIVQTISAIVDHSYCGGVEEYRISWADAEPIRQCFRDATALAHQHSARIPAEEAEKWRECQGYLWTALSMVRHAIEEVGPVGVLPSELATMPDPRTEGEALVAGLQKTLDSIRAGAIEECLGKAIAVFMARGQEIGQRELGPDRRGEWMYLERTVLEALRSLLPPAAEPEKGE